VRIDFEQIVGIVQQRRQIQSVLLTKMAQVRDRYNADVVIPAGTTQAPLPPLTPTLIANAIDNTALRAASVMPNIHSPALDPTKDRGTRSVEYANLRRRFLGYTYRKSNWNIGSRRLFRHLAGYATSAVMVVPDYKTECAQIMVRDPLAAYPEPKAPEDLSPIADCAFVYRKSAEWLAAHFPGVPDEIRRWGERAGSVQMWEVVEWIDDTDCVIGLLGPAYPWNDRNDPIEPMRWTMELRRYPNKAGMCTADMPRRVSLDTVATQVANMVGMADLMARLMSLDIQATEKSIFPDMYVLAKQGQNPRLVGDGKWKPGYSGDINLVVDADAIGNLRATPDPHNSQTIDRLERNFNISAGTVPQQGGESYGALRTGRGIDSLMGAAVDPRVQELHELMEITMEHVNEILCCVYKGYWGSKIYNVWSGWASDKGQITFTPDTHFETGENSVNYPIPGADVQTTTIELGQLYGTEAIDLHTLRSLHPYVEDPEAMAQGRLLDELDHMMLASLAQRAQQGQVPETDLARIKQFVKEGDSLEVAVAKTDRLAQQRQAAQAPAPEEGGMAPEAMAGMAQPGAGNEMMPPPTPGPPAQGLDNFRQLVRAVRAPNAGVGVNAPGA
jgi:hypothetical protein